MKILIIGHTGMLGNAVHSYLNQFHEIETITYRWPTAEFDKCIKQFDGDYIINCIGAIPQKTNNFTINTLLPIFLDINSPCPIIHPSTDCEIDDSIYGVSKRYATEWLSNYGKQTYVFKTSIIGIELNSADSLLCWFLNQNKVHGYTDALWNGITTLEWAKQCNNLINSDVAKNYNVFSTECISKYELLNHIKDIFHHDAEIEAISGIGKDKCLHGIKLNDIKQQLIELKEFYER
jgi:dTDP-4-dehydrorhamnose reductase